MTPSCSARLWPRDHGVRGTWEYPKKQNQVAIPNRASRSVNARQLRCPLLSMPISTNMKSGTIRLPHIGIARNQKSTRGMPTTDGWEPCQIQIASISTMQVRLYRVLNQFHTAMLVIILQAKPASSLIGRKLFPHRQKVDFQMLMTWVGVFRLRRALVVGTCLENAAAEVARRS
jgi:hypothetical protein